MVSNTKVKGFIGTSFDDDGVATHYEDGFAAMSWRSICVTMKPSRS